MICKNEGMGKKFANVCYGAGAGVGGGRQGCAVAGGLQLHCGHRTGTPIHSPGAQ